MTDSDSPVGAVYQGDSTPPDRDEGDPPYVMKTMLWKPPENEGEHREQMVNKGVYFEPTAIGAINSVLYETRGDKSPWELAYIDDIWIDGEGDDD